jgi:hypothetical protein
MFSRSACTCHLELTRYIAQTLARKQQNIESVLFHHLLPKAS